MEFLHKKCNFWLRNKICELFAGFFAKLRVFVVYNAVIVYETFNPSSVFNFKVFCKDFYVRVVDVFYGFCTQQNNFEGFTFSFSFKDFVEIVDCFFVGSLVEV